MKQNGQFLRSAGTIGMIGAAFFFLNLIIEYRYNLKPPGEGALFIANQTGFLLAMIALAFMLIGLRRTGAAGDTRFANISTGLLIGAWSTLVLAAATSTLLYALAKPADITGALYGIGGLGSLLGSILTAIAILRARRWTGWRLYTPAAYATYTLTALYIPLFAGSNGPNLWTETGWMIAFFTLALAVRTSNPTRDTETYINAGTETA